MVEYAGARWRVQRALGVDAVLLRSEAGEEVSADPLQIRLTEATSPTGALLLVVDELRYSDTDWTEATRRRDLIAGLASKPSRTAADVAAAATTLGVSPRRVWTLLRRLQMHGGEIAPFLPARRGARAKRLSATSEAIIQQAIDQHYGDHDLSWGIHAATAWAALSALSLASPGYHRSKRGRNVPSSVRVRVCSSRCAPRFVHCIC